MVQIPREHPSTLMMKSNIIVMEPQSLDDTERMINVCESIIGGAKAAESFGGDLMYGRWAIQAKQHGENADESLAVLITAVDSAFIIEGAQLQENDTYTMSVAPLEGDQGPVRSMLDRFRATPEQIRAEVMRVMNWNIIVMD